VAELFHKAQGLSFDFWFSLVAENGKTLPMRYSLGLVYFSFIISSISMACFSGPVSGTDLKSGQQITLNSLHPYKGRVVLFLSAKCPCSKSHEATLGLLAQKHSSFQFVGIHSNADESVTLAKSHFSRSPISFPILQDSDGKLADSFRAFKTPHAFILGPRGECWFEGGVDNSKEAPKADEFYLASALERLENGLEPIDKKARTLGCIIKR